MKTYHTLFTVALLASSALFPTRAQSFSSGSNGSLGALNVAATDADLIVPLPPDGRLHYTTVTIAAGRTLSFARNALNTPVQLLAQGDVVVNGVIDVSGQPAPGSPPIGGVGGPGGFGGGKPGFGADFPPGDGYGPGGGGGGTDTLTATGAGGGGYAFPGNGGSGFVGSAYGSPLLIPLIGGSGGGGEARIAEVGPGFGGAGGGGAILIASNTKIRIAAGGGISALGAVWHGKAANAGSGGAVRLLAPRVEGTGSVNVGGGFAGGGAGRIRVDCFDKTGLALNFLPLATTTVGTTMFVTFSTVPRLDLTKVADKDIPPGTGGTVQVLLPLGSDTNRTVTIQAKDFGADVPIRLTLTPESGSRIVIDTNIVNTAQNPATLVIPVGLPVNNLITIHAWTR